MQPFLEVCRIFAEFDYFFKWVWRKFFISICQPWYLLPFFFGMPLTKHHRTASQIFGHGHLQTSGLCSWLPPLYDYYEGWWWHVLTARSCSARVRQKESTYGCLTHAQTFVAAVPRTISEVCKVTPNWLSAYCRRCRASEFSGVGQTSIKCSTVSGSSHWSQSPSGGRPMQDRWWFNWQGPGHKRKIIVLVERGIGSAEKTGAGKEK